MTGTELRDSLSGDLDRLAADIISLSEINSGSYHPEGVNRCTERLAELASTLRPDAVDFIDVAPTPAVDSSGTLIERPVGQALRITKRRDAEFKICLFGHSDTVFEPEHPFQTVNQDGNTLYGPGVADCKGGLVQALEVLRFLDTVSWGQQIGWEYLVLSDEEVGSVGGKPLLEAAAANNDLGLGFEPALPTRGVAAARKGSLNVHTVVRGVAAHAGRAHHQGKSAILGASKLVQELEAHNAIADLTVNCGRISGGGALNAVPDFAIASYNVRVGSTDATSFVKQAFDDAAANSDLDVEVIWTSERPSKVRTPELKALLADVSEIADTYDDPIVPEDTGGACDGNDLAGYGLPNVDSLGICGGHIHSAKEFAEVDSVPARAGIIVDLIHRTYQRAATS